MILESRVSLKKKRTVNFRMCSASSQHGFLVSSLKIAAVWTRLRCWPWTGDRRNVKQISFLIFIGLLTECQVTALILTNLAALGQSDYSSYPVSFVWIYMIFASQIAAEREKELQKQQEEKQQANIALKKAKEEQAPKTFKAGVGKYINPATM